jgi:uncharacterized integral membrane protein
MEHDPKGEEMSDASADPRSHEGSAPPAEDSAPAAPKDPLRGSRTSRTWIALVAFGLLLVLLIVFIAQNTQRVHLSFLTFDGNAPLAVAVLAAGVAGVLLTAIAGSLRIWQLRRRVSRIK